MRVPQVTSATSRWLAAVTLAAEAFPDATDEVHANHAALVLETPGYALYLFRRARSRAHPLWTGEGPDAGNPWQAGGDRWDRVQAAGRILELPETDPVDAP